MQEKLYLLLGSNLGDRLLNINKAIDGMKERVGEVKLSSSIYQTSPWGLEAQPEFLNQVVMVETNLSPQEVLMETQVIEQTAKSVKEVVWGPRIIDVDILFYGDEIIDTPELKIPHPRIGERRFALVPLTEIAPLLKHPTSGETMMDLLFKCNDKGEVKIYIP
ncbi:MAG: 2-amino-4-hydroxy-6-hydroxymethyldihydropteridine diphosphokinase [Bacteroidetes bacterium]|nr:2-amino-4-hydroxy-6-hydroxymethyldihydropteridine diphosphokinase [Bacteroidota bacterium]